VNVATLQIDLNVSAASGQGLPSGPFAPFVFQFSTPPIGLSAWDGTTDNGGASGTTLVFSELTGEDCIRITDPAGLAAFVDDGSGPGTIFFDHSAAQSAMSSGCAPQSFSADGFASLEIEVRYRSCVAPDTTFCFGSNATCPCGNGGNVDAGCDNAQGTGGVRLTASGDPGLNTVALHGTGFPGSTFPTVLALRSPSAPSSPVPFGDGRLCLPSVVTPARVGSARASGGLSVHPLDHTAGTGVFDYQLWYRNEPASFCNPAAAFNSSSAITIDWP
jgi:hypothetical protein